MVDEIRVRFTASNKSWLSRAIRWATGERWSHCEIEIPGVGYLSSIWIGGARIRPFGYEQPCIQETIVISLPPEMVERVYNQAKAQLGKPYLFGVFLCTGLVRKAFEGIVKIHIKSIWSHIGLLTPDDVYDSIRVLMIEEFQDNGIRKIYREGN